MEQYIKKSAVLAKIEKIRRIEVTDNDVVYNGALDEIRYHIDTLEVKEVDLDEEFYKYCDSLYLKNLENDPIAGLFDCAKHFYELGIAVSNKAQKGD